MQSDFHFYAVYALCRNAGFSPSDARTVAYASQYVDDSTDGRAFTFSDGTSYNPVLTAHKALSLGNLTADVQKKIYLCFHFLPCVRESERLNGRDRALLTAFPGCPLSEMAVDRALALPRQGSGLIALGIALHSYADTWSHQGFSGLHGPENDTELLKERVKGRNAFSRFLRRAWAKAMELLLPAIGHGEVLHAPDLPFKTWRYYDFFNNRALGPLDNVERCLDAARAIHVKLKGPDWESTEPFFRSLFLFRGTEEERCANWRKAIALGRAGFPAEGPDKLLSYDPAEWEREALEQAEKGAKGPRKRAGFEQSAWVRFHKAARKQRKAVLEYLEPLGLDAVKTPFQALLNRFFFALAGFFGVKGRSSLSWKAARRALFRFCIYGALMVFGEVAFYTLVKLGRAAPWELVRGLFQFQWLVDARLNLAAVWDAPVKVLYGQASLWMFGVYGLIGLFGIEPAYHRLQRRSWLVRGLIYMTIILAMECVTGWLLKWGTGYEIWYYADQWDILRYTSLAIAPLWFVVGLMSENLVNLVNQYSRVKARLKELE